VHRRSNPRFARSQRGFTLLEIVAAFVVFAIAFAALIGIAGASLSMARRSTDLTQASLYAQSKLDPLAVGDKLEQTHESGRFDDRFSFELDVRKMDPPPAEGGVLDTIPVDLMRAELTVSWEESHKPRSAKFVTVRAIQTDPSASAGALAGSAPK
jgi:general secretion pathway protein I